MLQAGCVKECPACSHRELTPEESISLKKAWLEKGLNRYKDFIYPFRSVSENHSWKYRSKVILHTSWDEGRWKFGMLSNDKLIEIPECPVHHQIVSNAIKLLLKVLPEGKDFPLVYYAQYGAQIALILKSRNRVDNTWLTEDVRKELLTIGVEGLWVHSNPSAGRRLFEKTPLELIFGKSYSIDENGMAYSIGAFQQVIKELYLQTLDEAENFFETSNNDLVVDFYSGTGYSISRWLKTSKCIGIELGKQSFNLAGINVPEATLYRGKCAERIPQINEWLKFNYCSKGKIFIYVNPPRTGLEYEITNWIIYESKASKIAYLSCSAGTLRRDLDLLTKENYRVERIVPYDFFPKTYHFEALVLLRSN